MASRTLPSSQNPSTQDPPRVRDWGSLRTGESGSAFRGANRARGSRGGGVRGGRGPPTNSGPKGSTHPDTVKSAPSPSPTVPPASRKLSVPSTTTVTPKALSEKAVSGPAERGGRPKPGSRKQARATSAVVAAPTSPSETTQSTPPTPSRSAHHRRRLHSGKGSTATTKSPLPQAVKTQNSRVGATPPSQTLLHKDVPPHLAAAHEAEIRHDVDVLVERVRAVAMAENRPTTPGSHIDWAGDEDDSLPDLDDWGVTTTHTNATHDGNQSEEISPILEDALKPLPEPNSEVHQEEEREMESYNHRPGQAQESPIEPSFLPSPTEGTATIPSTTEKTQCNIVPTAVEEFSSPTLSDGKLPLHPSLPPKPVAAVENLRARGRSISKPSNLPPKPPACVAEEALTTKTERLSESIHAPTADERLALERVSSASSSERGLAASIHAPVPGLPESHSAPSLLSTRPVSAGSPAHSRSQTEGQPGIHQLHAAPPGAVSHRHGRSGASSPLGKHVYTHSRNHSTPAGGAGPRLPQASRPVITGEAISRLARTIGGLGPTPRTQTIPVAKDSTISS